VSTTTGLVVLMHGDGQLVLSHEESGPRTNHSNEVHQS
jgi:hypothetical protein